MSKDTTGEGKNWFARHKILTVLLIFVLLGVIGSMLDDETNNTTVSNNSAQQEQSVAYEVTATELLREYEANEVAAAAKYEDQYIEIRGTIASIGKDILDDPYLSLEAGDIIFSVQCMFDKSDSDQLVPLSKGQQVTVLGKVSGKLGNVVVKQCQVK